jgi:hypothetical protein
MGTVAVNIAVASARDTALPNRRNNARSTADLA